MPFLPAQDDNALRSQVSYLKEQHEKMPRKKPGDRYTIFGTLLGMIAGLFLGIMTRIPVLILLGFVGGGIIGTLVGGFLGAQVVKRRQAREHEDDTDHLIG